MSDRFDYEQQIMDCWNVVEDVKTVYETVMDTDADTDTIANALLGISTLYGMKFNKLFEMFEAQIKINHLTELNLKTALRKLADAEAALAKLEKKGKKKKKDEVPF